MSDPINHPSHYTSDASGVECIEIARWFDFSRGNALKYLWRAGLKSKVTRPDLEKALWYLRHCPDDVRFSPVHNAAFRPYLDFCGKSHHPRKTLIVALIKSGVEWTASARQEAYLGVLRALEEQLSG